MSFIPISTTQADILIKNYGTSNDKSTVQSYFKYYDNDPTTIFIDLPDGGFIDAPLVFNLNNIKFNLIAIGAGAGGSANLRTDFQCIYPGGGAGGGIVVANDFTIGSMGLSLVNNNMGGIGGYYSGQQSSCVDTWVPPTAGGSATLNTGTGIWIYNDPYENSSPFYYTIPYYYIAAGGGQGLYDIGTPVYTFNKAYSYSNYIGKISNDIYPPPTPPIDLNNIQDIKGAAGGNTNQFSPSPPYTNLAGGSLPLVTFSFKNHNGIDNGFVKAWNDMTLKLPIQPNSSTPSIPLYQPTVTTDGTSYTAEFTFGAGGAGASDKDGNFGGYAGKYQTGGPAQNGSNDRPPGTFAGETSAIAYSGNGGGGAYEAQGGQGASGTTVFWFTIPPPFTSPIILSSYPNRNITINISDYVDDYVTTNNSFLDQYFIDNTDWVTPDSITGGTTNIYPTNYNTLNPEYNNINFTSDPSSVFYTSLNNSYTVTNEWVPVQESSSNILINYLKYPIPDVSLTTQNPTNGMIPENNSTSNNAFTINYIITPNSNITTANSPYNTSPTISINIQDVNLQFNYTHTTSFTYNTNNNTSTCSLSITPDSFQSGTNTFSISFQDVSNTNLTENNGISEIQTLILSVVDPLIAYDISVNTLEDELVSIDLSGSNYGNYPFDFYISTLPSHGTLLLNGSTTLTSVPFNIGEQLSYTQQNFTLEYQVDHNYFGTDTFEYYVKDPSTDISSNTAIVDISINSVDDGPESYDVHYSVRLGKTINIDLSANDIDSSTDFSYTLISLPQYSKLSIDNIDISYAGVQPADFSYVIPNQSYDLSYTAGLGNIGYTGNTFQYYSTDDSDVSSNIATAFVFVSPDAYDASYILFEQGERLLSLQSTGTYNYDFYIDNLPTNGTLYYNNTPLSTGLFGNANGNINITYKPDQYYFGQDTFNWHAISQGLNGTTIDNTTNTATVDLSINKIDLPPIVGNIRVNFYINKQGEYFNEMNEKITPSITLEGFDIDNDSFKFYILNNPIFLDPDDESFYDPLNSATIGGLKQNDGTLIDSSGQPVLVTSDTSNVLFDLYKNSYQGTGVFSYYALETNDEFRASNIGYVFVNIRYAPTDGCDVGSGPDPPRTWTRASTPCISMSSILNGLPLTPSRLDERRKAEIFQYKNNNMNVSSKVLYSRLARGIRQRGQTFATQNQIFTDPNTQRLKLQTSNGPLKCPKSLINYAYTDQNDVPGPVRRITYDPAVPLTRWITQRQYKTAGDKWPQTGPYSIYVNPINYDDNIILPTPIPSNFPQPTIPYPIANNITVTIYQTGIEYTISLSGETNITSQDLSYVLVDVPEVVLTEGTLKNDVTTFYSSTIFPYDLGNDKDLSYNDTDISGGNQVIPYRVINDVGLYSNIANINLVFFNPT